MTINNSANSKKDNNMKKLIDLSTYQPIDRNGLFTSHHSPFTRKCAFTLAEVLITLGIIGVVAAMTIPTLMTNIRAKQYITKYKKALATLSNAARMSDSKYGFDFGGINGSCNENSGKDNPEEKQSLCALLNGTLQGSTFYYGMDKLANYEPKFLVNLFSMSGNNRKSVPVYQLSDGTLLLFSSCFSGMGGGIQNGCTRRIGKNPALNDDNEGTGCYGYIDVNGISLPNKETKCSKGEYNDDSTNSGDCIVNPKDVGDIFKFVLYDGSATPMSSSAWAAWDSLK